MRGFTGFNLIPYIRNRMLDRKLQRMIANAKKPQLIKTRNPWWQLSDRTMNKLIMAIVWGLLAVAVFAVLMLSYQQAKGVI